MAQRLIYLLRVASTESDPLASEALSAATATLHRPNLRYVGLSSPEVTAIRRELEQVGVGLTEKARNHLMLLLRMVPRGG